MILNFGEWGSKLALDPAICPAQAFGLNTDGEGSP